MAEKSATLKQAVEQLATVSGWSPDRAEKHVIGIVDDVTKKADSRAKLAAQKVLDKTKGR